MPSSELVSPFGTLEIDSSIEGFNSSAILGSFAYSRLVSNYNFTVRLGYRVQDMQDNNYRAEMFRRGLYLGHHMGPRGSLYIGEGELETCLEDVRKEAYDVVFWSFCVKMYLSLLAMRSRTLHLKATALQNIDNGKITLLVGRGGSGKTTLAHCLNKADFRILGNTHAIVDDDHVWTVNSWTRSRTAAGTVYLPPKDNELVGDGTLERIVIVDHNVRGEFVCNELAKRSALGFFSQFVWATGTYDLKEDLCDLLSPRAIVPFLQEELVRLEQLTERIPTWYLSSDIYSEGSLEKTRRFFLGGRN